MDADEALAELTRRSRDVEHAAVLDASGDLVAATVGAPAVRLVRAGRELLDRAASLRTDVSVDRIEVHLASGAVLVVRAQGHTVVATTSPEPPAALVVHDLRACLDRLAVPARPRRRAAEEEPDA